MLTQTGIPDFPIPGQIGKRGISRFPIPAESGIGDSLPDSRPNRESGERELGISGSGPGQPRHFHCFTGNFRLSASMRPPSGTKLASMVRGALQAHKLEAEAHRRHSPPFASRKLRRASRWALQAPGRRA